LLTVVTGVSGSGKSLGCDILLSALAKNLYGIARRARRHQLIEGLITRQSDRDRSIADRPHAATRIRLTYTRPLHADRELYAMLPESRERGYKPGPLFLSRERRPLRKRAKAKASNGSK